MKSLQENFNKFLTEEPADLGQAAGFARVGAPGGVPSVDDVVMGDPFTLTPENVQKLNAYLQAASYTPVINPYFLLNRIQTKLSQIHLNFEMPKMVGNVGSVTKPLNQFGGTYGYQKPLGTGAEITPGKPIPPVSDNTIVPKGSFNYPKIGSSDGISERVPGGLDLKIHWTCVKGLYTMDVQIVPGKRSAPTDIKEAGDLEEGVAEHPHQTLVSHGWKLRPHTGGKSPAAYDHPNHKDHAIFLDPTGAMDHFHKTEHVFHAMKHSSLKQHLNNFHGKSSDVNEENIDEKHIGFDKLKGKLAHEKGVTDPGALAAAIGDKKYGKAKMHHAAASGHAIHEEDGEDEHTPSKATLGSPSAVRKAMKRHRNIKNPFSLAWYLKKHGDKYSGR